MTRSVSCAPCAKRKVRCDRKEPCSNCKRRKQDQCIYPTRISDARIKQLEEAVKRLGSNSEVEDDAVTSQTRSSPASFQAQAPVAPIVRNKWNEVVNHPRQDNPIIVNDGGMTMYIESYVQVPTALNIGAPVANQSSVVALHGIAGIKGTAVVKMVFLSCPT